jgi:hypothetical protein
MFTLRVLLPSSARGLFRGSKFVKIIKTQALGAVIFALLILIGVCSIFPQWTSKTYDQAITANGTQLASRPYSSPNNTAADEPVNSYYLSSRFSKKISLLFACAVSDFIAGAVASTVHHRRPGIITLLKQLAINFIPTMVLWLYFGSIIGIGTLNSASSGVSSTVKVVILGYILPVLKFFVLHLTKVSAKKLQDALKVDNKTAMQFTSEFLCAAEFCMSFASM